ncbi:MAG: nitronate monooxygenase, partial [Syntrophaceticus sp.]|nr:nitronate monooxygenase [Syntrophaceticus sp.]
MITTRVSKLLGIKYPLLQGGMAWIATGKLAGAVSEAGALGIIAAGSAEPQWLEKEIAVVKKITDQPFGVNVMLTSPYVAEIIDLVIREKVPVITTGAGNPGKLLPRLKESGCKVLPVVASVALARRLARQGADAIIAEGTEAGGHIGQTTTMCLVPMVVDAVDIP